MSKEVMELARDALIRIVGDLLKQADGLEFPKVAYGQQAIVALQKELDRLCGDPVAWMFDYYSEDRDEMVYGLLTDNYQSIEEGGDYISNVVPLYTSEPTIPKGYWLTTAPETVSPNV